MTGEPKRHHQVPQFYLERFAANGKLAVRWRDGKRYETSPKNVAVESGFYDIPDGMGGVSKEIETGLANIERAWLTLYCGGLTAMADCPVPVTLTARHWRCSSDCRWHARRPTENVLFPRRVVDWANGREVTSDLVAEFLETQYLGFRPGPPEVDGAFTLVNVSLREESHTLSDEFAVEMMLRAAWELSRRLLGLTWSIEFDRRGELIISDTPVVVWRQPSPRDNFEGFGIENADEVRFPLDPGKQFVLSRRARKASLDVAVHRVRRSNADMAGACHRFIVGSPENRAQMDAHRLDPWRPLLRFNVGPGFEEAADGTRRRMAGDIVHMWTPRRAGCGPERMGRRRSRGRC
jgi:hypothetical protein